MTQRAALSREAELVLEGLGLHMLLLDVGRVEIDSVRDPRIEATLRLGPGHRVVDWVAATCRLIDNPHVQRIAFERHDRWGDFAHTITCDFVLAGNVWVVVIRLGPPTLQKD